MALLRATGLGALLVVCAGLLDAEPLYVPGIAFLVVSALCAAWVVLGSRGVTVTRTIDLRRVVEDDPVVIDVVVRGTRPLPTGQLLDGLLGTPAPLTAGRRATRVRIVARFARRGRRVLAPPRVAVRDPFGLLTRLVSCDAEAHELLVLPRIEPVRAAEMDGEGDRSHVRRGRPAVAAEVELDCLRPHRPGTPASRIAWHVYARSGDLVERRLRADADTRPLVVLDPRGATAPEDLDAAVRAAASLAVDLARRGGCALLLPGDRRPHVLESTLAGWPHVHARLALVTGSGAPPAISALGSRRGDVVYVTARRTTRPPRALLAAPGGGRILVVPGLIPGRRAVFTVAGCAAYELTAARRRAAA